MSIKNLHIPQRSGLGEKGITVLAGDIGGTKTNLAFYQATDSGLKVLETGRYPSAEYASSVAIMQQFLSEKKCPKPDRICLGVAGPVLNGKVDLTNLSWDIDIEDIKKLMGVEAVFLLNDLESMAYGLAGLTEEDFIVLHPGNGNNTGNMAVIAPGTGLGQLLHPELAWARLVYTGMVKTIFHFQQKAVMQISLRVPMLTLLY